MGQDQDQVSRGVSILCWLALPIANVLWKPPGIRYTGNVKNGNKVQFSNKVMI